ncbi:hypothetical protein IMPR6_70162 [Imperialibacter sp. EC-SDR9]|nr:hypothetical protein IMPERIA89_60089 [Imperialibacter sp. 89]CAD5290165.1 hypothetical protein IMPERIA75_630087 [Imperialibacter sp. 75]VVT34521.1 hypothetical protein IMPR6_70162 [Imperialibacter sp. EC-SDR9]
MKVTCGKRLLKDIDSIQTLSVNLLLQETLELIESAQTIRDIPNIKKSSRVIKASFGRGSATTDWESTLMANV